MPVVVLMATHAVAVATVVVLVFALITVALVGTDRSVTTGLHGAHR